MGKAIVVVGSLNMDLVVRTPRHPQIGETIIATSFQTFPGGKGANQAVAAARLGGEVRMIGRVGNDGFGATLITMAATDGVDTRFIQRDTQAPTGVALITVDGQGQNSIVVASGANMRLTPEDIDAAEESFRDAAVLLLQLESPLSAIVRAIELGRKHGLKVVLNPAPAQELEVSFLRSVDYLIPNQNELALLSGAEQTEEGIKRLVERGIQPLVVTLGGKGVVLVDEHGRHFIPAIEVHTIDSTAAGDAFVGGFAIALTEGRSPREATVWGNAAGAIAVTRQGAQPSLPSRSELDELLEKSRDLEQL